MNTTPMEEVLRIRDAMFCEDMAVPDDLTSYSPADVRSYFESGGKPATRPMSPPPPELAPLTLVSRSTPPQPRKTLSLGAAPAAPPGENCDVRDILASAVTGQDESFAVMMSVLRAAPDTKVHQAIETLTSLHRSFGGDEET